jgi:hypothetical protein
LTKSGDVASLGFFFAKKRVGECNRDFSPIGFLSAAYPTLTGQPVPMFLRTTIREDESSLVVEDANCSFGRLAWLRIPELVAS